MKLLISLTLALAIGVALAAQRPAEIAPADLVVLNGKVYTAGKNATFAQAVAVRGKTIDGKVVYRASASAPSSAAASQVALPSK